MHSCYFAINAILLLLNYIVVLCTPAILLLMLFCYYLIIYIVVLCTPDILIY